VPKPLTVHRQTYNIPTKLLNALASTAISLGLPVGTLEAASILKAAQKRTGLGDYGGDAFRDPMAILLEEARSSSMTPLARVICRQTWILSASNRLKIRHFLTENPSTRENPIQRPLFILGFPRTGTTLLQNLLSLAPGARSLKFWELVCPIPVCDDFAKDRARRIKTANQKLQLAYLVAPEQASVHEIKATTPEECWPLFTPSFAVLNYELGSGMKGYGEWLLGHDMVSPYQDYKKQLQILASREPTEQYVLKCPEHLWFLDALQTVFADACIVWTHRDPFDSVASYCSLISMNRRTMYGTFDPKELGAHISQAFHTGVERAMAARERMGSDNFFDVRFDELVKDPKATVRAIREHFSLDQAPELDGAMDRWLANKRSDGKGKHIYDGAFFGLDRKKVHEQFRPYIDRYSIPIREG